MKNENGKHRPNACSVEHPAVQASTTLIKPANTGFGGCVPPAGVMLAKASSIKAPTLSPSTTSPKLRLLMWQR